MMPEEKKPADQAAGNPEFHLNPQELGLATEPETQPVAEPQDEVAPPADALTPDEQRAKSPDSTLARAEAESPAEADFAPLPAALAGEHTAAAPTRPAQPASPEVTIAANDANNASAGGAQLGASTEPDAETSDDDSAQEPEMPAFEADNEPEAAEPEQEYAFPDAATEPTSNATNPDTAQTTTQTTTPGQPTPQHSPDAQTDADDTTLQQERVRSELLKTVLATDLAEFSKVTEAITLPELVMLMEELSNEVVERDTIRKVGQLKRKFDELYTARFEEVKDVDVEDPDQVEAKEATVGLSERFSRALGGFNRRKAAYEEALEKQKAENSRQKATLLDELKEIVHNEKLQAINKVRNIQKRWKDIGPVMAEDVENYYQSFKALLDQFYTMRKGYVELVEQDRKINLEKKQALIQELKAIVQQDHANSTPEFWQESLDRVKALHAQWKAIGPVPNDQSEIVWEIFKTATDEYYQVRRTFFEARDAERDENAKVKRELLEKLLAFANLESAEIEVWRKNSEEVKGLQDRWREVGEVPFRQISDLNKAYRDALDAFYDRRSEYFSELDKENEKYIKAKEDLVNQATAIKDSEDFTRTAEVLKRLQRDWKRTGPDTHRDARKLQKKFRKMCDTFFRRHKDWIANQEATENANLERKQEAMAQVQALTTTANPQNPQQEAFNAALEQFLMAGHVPLKERESIEDKFWHQVEDYHKKAVPDPEQRELALMELRYRSFSNRPGSVDRLERELKKQERKMQEFDDRVKQYETNINFISPGKKGDSLRSQIQEKIDHAIEQRSRANDRLKALRKMLKDARQAAKETQTTGAA